MSEITSLRSSSDATLPPMLLQYLEYKERFPDSILFFQVGDFYEVFFEDARKASHILNITLTSRDKSANNPIPMCGVPIASLDNYLDRIIQAGFGATIVSQKAVPKNFKGTVPRFLDRVVSPGLRVLGGSEVRATFAVCCVDSDMLLSIAFSDVSQGVIYVKEQVAFSVLADFLTKIQCDELVVFTTDKQVIQKKEFVNSCSEIGIKVSFSRFIDILSLAQYSVEGIFELSEQGRHTCRLLIKHLDSLAIATDSLLSKVSVYANEDRMHIDSSSIYTLGILDLQKNDTPEKSLFGLLASYTPKIGRDRLKDILISPFASQHVIKERQEVLEVFINNQAFARESEALCSRLCDLARISSRLLLSVAKPTELALLRDSLELLKKSIELYQPFASQYVFFATLCNLFARLREPLNSLREILAETPASSQKEVGVIKIGFDSKIDELNELLNQGTSWFNQLAEAEKARTGLASLKIKHNHVLGYFFEVSQAQASQNAYKIPADYIQRQGTTNSVRFVSETLKQAEKEYVSAYDRLQNREAEIYTNLCETIKPFCSTIREAHQASADLAVYCGMSAIVDSSYYSKPEIDETSTSLFLLESRHPTLLQKLKNKCVPNSVELSDGQGYVLSGPNMGGKSTYLRQIAMNVVLAHIGSYVPSKKACIPITDKIYARIGASDNLSEGESTFMVEMRDVAKFVANVTSKSLVLVDEVGRGTSTADGEAIARCVLHWLLNTAKCKFVFATHFLELCKWASGLHGIKTITAVCEEIENTILFTHKIETGVAKRAYGFEVAKLAGIPREVLDKADTLMTDTLNQSYMQDKEILEYESTISSLNNTLLRYSKFFDKISNSSVDSMTPLEALNILNELKKMLITFEPHQAITKVA
jgi:DNA mismatch repair protein MutS